VAEIGGIMVAFFTTLQPLEIGVSDPAALEQSVVDLDRADGIDEVLIGYSSIWPHNHATVPYLLALTQRLSPILAVRPGVMHPAAAARLFATLDVLAGGRFALNVVTGGSDKDLAREGDYLPKVDRYRRATEYVEILKRAWTTDESFCYDGEFYTADHVHPLIQPLKRHIPIYMGGESDEAVDFGAQHADIYMLWGEPLAGTQERIERVRKIAADTYQRDIDFSLSLRLFLGDTDDEAWEKARAVESEIRDAQGSTRFLRSSGSDKSIGRERALALTDQELHDDCFWTGLTKLLGGFANSQSLVGTPDRVLEALRHYTQIGINTFLVTTGAEAAWDSSLSPFLLRAKRELGLS
jgi:alkanesulfonate monooxygenase